MITMLVSVVALLATDPAPTPRASAAPTQLKEIGRVHVVSTCTAIVVHANAAISDALANDSDLAITINRLRTTNLESDNAIQRRNQFNDLATLAGRVRTASSSGDAEVKRLRVYAAASTDPQRKIELKAFADALGGALYRQKKVAVDLDKALTIIQGRRERAEVASTIADPSGGSSFTVYAGRILPNDQPIPTATSPGYNLMLREVAENFQQRQALILTDEGVAADHTVAATTGC